MGILSWPIYWQVAALCAIAIVAYSLRYLKITELVNFNHTSRRTIRRKGKLLGCEEPYTETSWFFGLERLREELKAHAEHKALPSGFKKFKDSGSWTHAKSFLGHNIIITVEPQNIQTVLATDFHSFGLGEQRRQFLPWLGPGIFSTDGAEWKHSRENLRPSFTRGNISDVDQFESHVQHFLQKIPRDGTTIDLMPKFNDLAMDISTEFLFGSSTNALAGHKPSEDVAKFVQAWNECQAELSEGGGKKGITGFFFEDPSFAKNCGIVQAFVDKMIAEATSKLQKKNGIGRDTFLSSLTESVTSPITLRNECLNVLLAGRDTTSAVLGNLFWVISHYKDIENKLRQEIADLPSQIAYDDLKNLKYLRAVINESLRLHPIVPMNARGALRDTTLPVGGGKDGKSPIFIPKGAIVAWNLYTMHRREDLYGSDAEEFKPERWIDTDAKKGIRPGWGYLPFNGGPRICIGQQFAITEISYVVARLLQELPRIESRDPAPWKENITITCSSLNGCKIAIPV